MIKSSCVSMIGRTVLLVLGLVSLLSVDAFAAGLDKVTGALTKVQEALELLSVAVVTLAIAYVGYKILFGGSTFKELAPVIIGALIIGGCSGIASLLIG